MQGISSTALIGERMDLYDKFSGWGEFSLYAHIHTFVNPMFNDSEDYHVKKFILEHAIEFIESEGLVPEFIKYLKVGVDYTY